MLRWLQLLTSFALSVALVAAPCKNCEPKPAKARPQHCQHDCCPKPRPEQPACKWQPADYAAIEAKQETQAAPEFSFETVAAATLGAPETVPAAAPQVRAEPPPLYLTFQQLRN